MNALDKLQNAAVDWWKGKRPTSFNFHEHLKHPTVNCVNPREKKLARAIVGALKHQIMNSR